MPPARFDHGARRIALWGLTTLSTLVLLFSYRTSTSSQLPTATGVPAADTAGSTVPASGAAAGSSAASTATATATGSYTGSAADTRWGPVQVRVTVSSGSITAVDVVAQPDGNHKDQEINAEAVPQLVEETLEAQSADIDMVSGATVTSEGYVESLQSALDQAGVG